MPIRPLGFDSGSCATSGFFFAARKKIKTSVLGTKKRRHSGGGAAGAKSGKFRLGIGEREGKGSARRRHAPSKGEVGRETAQRRHYFSRKGWSNSPQNVQDTSMSFLQSNNALKTNNRRDFVGSFSRGHWLPYRNFLTFFRADVFNRTKVFFSQPKMSRKTQNQIRAT